MSFKLLILISIALILIELTYFWLARRFAILDKPNHRSLHEIQTIRGGGVLFYFSVLLFYLFYSFDISFFFIGLTIIALVSFIDDVKDLPSYVRLPSQLISIGLLLFDLGVFQSSTVYFFVLLVIGTGILNAYNFMDGINGITGLYSLVTLIGLLLINLWVVQFESSEFILIVIISVAIFNFFNFRHKAICFAGDVGSVSMAFIIIYFLGKLILTTGDLSFILLLMLYGVDSIFTIIERIKKKENIFQAHRQHLFQLGVYYEGWRHLKMSSAYALIQALINVIVITLYIFKFNYFYLSHIILVIVSVLAYWFIKRSIKLKHDLK